jgi:hypothetical protein
MLDMVTQAEPHQYRDHERNHAHPYEHPQVGTVSLGRFVCTVFVIVHCRGSVLKGSV